MYSTPAKVLAFVIIAQLLTACAGGVIKPTSEIDKDTTGQFDGLWAVTVSKGASLQYIQNWQFDCGDMSHQFEMTVVDGAINVESDSSEATAYVAANGSFKLQLPLDDVAEASGISDVPIANGKQQLILVGTLGDRDSTGYLTLGVAEFGYAGCTSKVNFTRAMPASKV